MNITSDYRKRKDEKKQKRVQALEKEGPPIEMRFGDDDVVVLTKQPMQWNYPAGPTRAGGMSDEPFGQKFKALYKVCHNGVHCGWIVSLNGWGRGAELVRLGGDGSFGFYDNSWKCVKGIKNSGARDLLAAMVPKLVRSGQLGSLEEQVEQRRQEKQRRKASENEARQHIAKIRRERVQEAEASRSQLIEDIAVLDQLMKRGVLTNLETDVIARSVTATQMTIDQLNKRINENAPQQ